MNNGLEEGEVDPEAWKNLVKTSFKILGQDSFLFTKVMDTLQNLSD